MSRSNLRLSALVAAAFAAVALPASAGYLADNGISVEDTGNGTFTVRNHAGSTNVDYWCAAGDFAAAKLRLSPTVRVYRTTPVKGGHLSDVGFSLSAADGIGFSGILGFRDDGGMTVAMAQEMCQVAKLLGR